MNKKQSTKKEIYLDSIHKKAELYWASNKQLLIQSGKNIEGVEGNFVIPCMVDNKTFATVTYDGNNKTPKHLTVLVFEEEWNPEAFKTKSMDEREIEKIEINLNPEQNK